jgi:hypothetical protein
MSVTDSPDFVFIPKFFIPTGPEAPPTFHDFVIPTGAGARATAEWRNLLFACGEMWADVRAYPPKKRSCHPERSEGSCFLRAACIAEGSQSFAPLAKSQL